MAFSVGIPLRLVPSVLNFFFCRTVRSAKGLMMLLANAFPISVDRNVEGCVELILMYRLSCLYRTGAIPNKSLLLFEHETRCGLPPFPLFLCLCCDYWFLW